MLSWDSSSFKVLNYFSGLWLRFDDGNGDGIAEIYKGTRESMPDSTGVKAAAYQDADVEYLYEFDLVSKAYRLVPDGKVTRVRK